MSIQPDEMRSAEKRDNPVENEIPHCAALKVPKGGKRNVQTLVLAAWDV